jgi:hypothetical protein
MQTYLCGKKEHIQRSLLWNPNLSRYGQEGHPTTKNSFEHSHEQTTA